jgi:hypothetical protein
VLSGMNLEASSRYVRAFILNPAAFGILTGLPVFSCMFVSSIQAHYSRGEGRDLCDHRRNVSRG